MTERNSLRSELLDESQRHYAAYVLFNQAMADDLGLHPTDLQCLSLLSLDAEPHTVGEIARMTGLTSGSATRVVDRLQRAGMARRVKDPDDARQARVELIESGMGRIATAWEEPAEAFVEVVSRYDADELATIVDYLRRTSEVGREQAERIRRKRPLKPAARVGRAQGAPGVAERGVTRDETGASELP